MANYWYRLEISAAQFNVDPSPLMPLLMVQQSAAPKLVPVPSRDT